MLGTYRSRFEPCKRFLGRQLGGLGLPPWFFTLLGVVLALAAAWQYQAHHPGRAVLIGTAAALCDFVDGAVARFQKSQSFWGDYLDAIADRLLEIILLLSMAGDFPVPVCWALASSLLISYCKPRVALVIRTDDHDWPGIGDHADRLMFILLSMLLTACSKTPATCALNGLTVMCTVGTLQRIAYARRLISQAHKPVDLAPQHGVAAPG